MANITTINIYHHPEELEKCPDGTEVEVLNIGSEWQEDWGKRQRAIKCGKRLYYITGFDEISEMNELGYEQLIAKREVLQAPSIWR